MDHDGVVDEVVLHFDEVPLHFTSLHLAATLIVGPEEGTVFLGSVVVDS
jgi:hypothetical protein